ncbi:MAG: hypothetical protein ACYCOU_03210 [Sulfobacillus sp.]
MKDTNRQDLGANAGLLAQQNLWCAINFGANFKMSCSFCKSPGVTKTTCPLNPLATHPNPQKHPLAGTKVPLAKPGKFKSSVTATYGDTDRLSARWYYDAYGPDTVGDRCRTRPKDHPAEVDCLRLRSNGSPYWSKKGQGSPPECGDWSIRCRDSCCD